MSNNLLNYSSYDQFNYNPYIIFFVFFVFSLFFLYPPIFEVVVISCQSKLLAAILISSLIASLAFILSTYELMSKNNNYSLILQN